MAYILGAYQNPDIKQQTIDLLNNLSTTPGVGGGVSIISGSYTPSIGTETGAGSLPAGKNSVSILNQGAANGTVMGQQLLPGTAVTFAAPLNGTLGAIAFNATGTSFLITYITPL